MKTPAVILLSGGLDSATVLAWASQQGFDCYCLSLNYHQRHVAELVAAQAIAKHFGAAAHRVITLDLTTWGGSALTDLGLQVPETLQTGIPITYVPARNTIMLSLSLAWAEVLGSQDIFIGVNAVDYSGYPDCRPEYISAFETMANLATQSAIEGNHTKIHTPLMQMSKAEIIRLGSKLGVNYALTVSCYQADSDGKACGRCDACRLRQVGFIQSGIADTTRYQDTFVNPNHHKT